MSKKSAEKVLEECCVKCGSKEFAIEFKTEKRFCGKCRHVWLAMDEKDLMILALKKEISLLQGKLTKLQSEKAKVAESV